MEVVEIIGKILFSLLFINSGINHLINSSALADYARIKRLPFPKLNVILSGLVIIVAPILFIFNIIPLISLWVLAVFLLIAAFMFHDFWMFDDEETKVREQIQFSKDISLLGAVLVIISLL